MIQTVDEITIQVPHDIAETYRHSTIEERRQIAERIGIIFSAFDSDCSLDLVGFKNALLDAIERSNPHYHDEIKEALTEGLTLDRPKMTADKFGAWLASI